MKMIVITITTKLKLAQHIILLLTPAGTGRLMRLGGMYYYYYYHYN